MASNYLLVRVSWNNFAAESPTAISGITWNGVALSSIGNVTNGDDGRVEFWDLIDPDLGTHDIVVTFNAAFTGATKGQSFVARDLEGVNTADPHNTFTSEAEGDGSIAVTSVAGQLVFDMFGSEPNAADAIGAEGAGQTPEWDHDNVGVDPWTSKGSYETAAGASTTMSWTLGDTDHQTHAGVAVKPSGGSVTLGNLTELSSTEATAARTFEHTIDGGGGGERRFFLM